MSYGSSWFSRAGLFCRRKSYVPTYLGYRYVEQVQRHADLAQELRRPGEADFAANRPAPVLSWSRRAHGDVD